MKLKRILGVIIIILIFKTDVHSQRNVSDSVISTPWISVQYGINWTGGDLNERLGLLNHVGLFLGWKTARNWVFGVEGSFIFGNDVRVTGLFDHLMDSKGNITDECVLNCDWIIWLLISANGKDSYICRNNSPLSINGRVFCCSTDIRQRTEVPLFYI